MFLSFYQIINGSIDGDSTLIKDNI